MSLRDQIIPYGKQVYSGAKEAILANLFRGILEKAGLPESRFNVLVDKYVINTMGHEDAKELTSVKGNMKKEYLRSHMTWKVFVRGFRIINARSFTITLHAKFSEGDVKEAGVARRLVFDSKYLESDLDLTDPDKVLYALYKDLNVQTRTNMARFNKLFDMYAVRSHIPMNMKDISSARGNLNKEFKKDTMSWKVFIKGLIFLTATNVEFGIYLPRADGTVIHSFQKVVLDSENMKDEDES